MVPFLLWLHITECMYLSALYTDSRYYRIWIELNNSAHKKTICKTLAIMECHAFDFPALLSDAFGFYRQWATSTKLALDLTTQPVKNLVLTSESFNHKSFNLSHPFLFYLLLYWSCSSTQLMKKLSVFSILVLLFINLGKWECSILLEMWENNNWAMCLIKIFSEPNLFLKNIRHT